MKLYSSGYSRNTLLIRLIVCFILIVLITLCCSSYFTYNYFSSSFKGEITNLNHRVLSQLSAFSDEFLLKNVNEMALNLLMSESNNQDFITVFSGLLENNSEALLNVHQKLRNVAFSNRDIVDSICLHSVSNGILISSNFIKYTESDLFNRSDEFGWIDQFYKSGSSITWLNTRNTKIYSDPIKDTGDIITIVCSYPISSVGDSVQGCVAINIKEDALNRNLANFNTMNFGSLFIVDNAGKIISHSSKESLYKDISSEPFIKKVLSSASPADFITKYEKSEYVASFCRSRFNNWTYISLVPTELFYQQDYQIRKNILIISFIILAVAFILSNFLSLLIYTPFKRLINKFRLFSPSGGMGAQCASLNEFMFLDNMFDHMSGKINDLQDTLGRNANMIKHIFLNELLSNRVATGEVQNRLKLSGLDFPNSYYVVATFSMRKALLMSQPQDRIQYMKYRIIDMIKSMDSGPSLLCPVETGSTALTVIMNAPAPDFNPVREFISAVQNFCLANLGFYVTAGIGDFTDNISMIHKSYMEARTCACCRFIHPDRDSCYFCDIAPGTQTEDDAFGDVAERLDKYLKLGNFDEIKCIVNKFQAVVASGSTGLRQVRKQVCSMTAQLRQYAAGMGIDAEGSAGSFSRDSLLSSDNIYEFSEAYLQAVKSCFDILSCRRLNKNSELIEKVKQYVMENLHLELSLNSAADAIHISPYYLSKLFKEEAKVNYIDFVTSCKMEKAKELMLKTNLNIEEITSRIGYSHATYFSRKFKEYTGMTPNEYRRAR